MNTSLKEGMILGNRIIIKRLPNYGRNSYWLFKCQCGNVDKATGNSLQRSNNCKKCSMKNKRKEYGECSFNGLYLRYKHNAISRNLKFLLNKEEFKTLTKQNCYYCGTSPSEITKGKTAYGEYIYNGIDRIDSSLNYTIDNCVSCCTICNKAKNNLTKEQFSNWIARLIKHHGG